MTETQSRPFPNHSRVVIVGGGIMGVGLAYHLALEGWGADTVLLEKAELTSGSTWHAAGQITHSTSNFTLGKCVDYNTGLYSGGLEADTGQPVTWHGCGSLRLAYTDDEMDWLRHTLSVGRALGFRIELVGPDRVAKLHPFYNIDGVQGALHTPDDGHVDPTNVTMAMAAGARSRGTRIIRRCRATHVSQSPAGEWIVETERGSITCEHVVNAGGTYARQMGEWSGLQLPMTSMTHHYFVTDTVPEFEPLGKELPVIRDDKMVSGYIRMEQKRGLIGIYEKERPKTVWEDHCPWEAENELFDPDYDRVMPWLEESLNRMPIFSDLGITRSVHGAISHPPDGNPLIGPAPGVRNYWCCCGTQIGIGWGPGLSRELACWMVHGAADISMREFDPRRFGAYATKEWQAIKAKEDYCLRHEIPFPHYNRLAGRPIKTSPLYERLKDKGAVFEEVYGHERPRWFAPQGVDACDRYGFHRNEVHDIVGAECCAVRERAGIMDISAFTKIEVAGHDAEVLLNRLVANRLPAIAGGIRLTHMLNARGRIEMELTVVRTGRDRFYLVCAAFFEQRLLDHLHAHRRTADIVITNLSDEWAAVSLNGPGSRDLLSQCTAASLSNADFRWMSAQKISVAGHSLWAFRMSYAGELGWELHGHRGVIGDVYDAVWNAGADLGLMDYGSFAMNSLRMEKGFKGAGELTNEITLPEANVMRFVDLQKEFVGSAATRQNAQSQLPWLCAYLEIVPDGVNDGHGGEAVLLNGEVIGATSSVAFGHSVGKILAFAYVRPEAAAPGTALEVVIAGEPRDAVVRSEPAFDPESLRPRAAG